MLRVEASNLPKSHRAPRPRRLLPNPPVPRRPAAPSRFEIIPPRDAASAPTAELALPTMPPRAPLERWSVKLELGDDEIAKLYGQGMTRGAVVWKRGMVEWRPLLITPELSGLLRRTRITIDEAPTSTPLPQYVSAPSVGDELTLPRPALVPREVADEGPARVPISTVAPTALDVEGPPPKSKSRRPLELGAVAAAAFVLAWLGHATLHPDTTGAAPARFAAALPPAAGSACAPPLPGVSTVLAGTTIPTVSIADLPLAGAKSTTTVEGHGLPSSRVSARAARSSSDAPDRSDLVGALSRVAGAASGCGERGGPVRVVVTFANSGVARSIQVSGPNLPAPTRSCIIGAASRARIPAFSGEPVTVAKTL